MLSIRTFGGALLLSFLVACTPAFASTLVVANTGDSGAGSLREALGMASAGDTIVFATGVTGTIALASTLSITQSLTIQGPGAANLVLDGQATVQVVNITAVSVTVSGVTIANGATAGQGGGILNAGALTISNSLFSGNKASNGGGISNAAGATLSVDTCTFQNNTATSVGGGAIITFGPATVSNSTLSGNTAPINGGAINVQPGGTLTLVGSTLSGSRSNGLGGALSNLGTLSIFGSTLAGNQGGSGAAIATGNTNVTINNSVFADNAATNAPGAFSPSEGFTASNNVFYNNTVAGMADDQTGYGTSNFIAATAEPLAALGNYGGSTQTMLPVLGSAAICAGAKALIQAGVTTDQRGAPNTNAVYTGYSDAAPCVDAGAVQTNYQLLFTSQPPASTVVGAAMNPAPAVTLQENGATFSAAPAPTLTLSLNGAGTLSGGSAPLTNGVATFPSLSIDALGATDTLSATLALNATPVVSTDATSDPFAIANSTSTALASSANPAVFGQSIVFTATITPNESTTVPTGTVTFYDGATSLGTGTLSDGVATFATAALTVGAHSIGATYEGDTTDQPSSALLASPQQVNMAATTATVSSSGSITLGQSIEIGATVVVTSPGAGTPTGSITVADGGTGAGDTCTIALPATSCTLTPGDVGPKTLTATYSGDDNFSGSIGTNSFTVNAAATGLTLATSMNPSVFGGSITFTATVTPAENAPAPSGTVTFYDGATALGTAAVNSGAATFATASLGVGSHSINATYGGDVSSAMSSAALTPAQVVNQAATTTTIAPLASISLGQSATVSVNVAVTLPGAGTPTGTIAVSDGGTGNGDTCTITLPATNCSLTPTSAGNPTLVATYSGDSNFTGSANAASLSVSTATSTVTLTSSPNPSTEGQAVTFTATVSAIAPASVGVEARSASASTGSHAAIAASVFGKTLAAAASPTGSVTFSDGSTLLATVALDANGMATYSTTALSAGSHTITASYSGDANNAAATIANAQQVNLPVITTPATPAPALSIWMLALLGLGFAGVGVRYARSRAAR